LCRVLAACLPAALLHTLFCAGDQDILLNNQEETKADVAMPWQRLLLQIRMLSCVVCKACCCGLGIGGMFMQASFAVRQVSDGTLLGCVKQKSRHAECRLGHAEACSEMAGTPIPAIPGAALDFCLCTPL
jgi:hypothetical protein